MVGFVVIATPEPYKVTKTNNIPPFPPTPLMQKLKDSLPNRECKRMDNEQQLPVGHLVADDTDVSIPVVEILTGRGFVTGKSGSGKSNTASVVVEQLLDAGYPVAIIDADGEYYGLKEEYELLHVGADEECDIQVGAEHAEKVASLALEQNVPIIIDVSGYLDDDEANALIRETARHLFAKEKKLKKPFLLVVEECHEYIPEGGGMGETGKMLIKVGKRGRKHGLGIMGISQRPADVKKDFITQANWLVWHRLTWENDTKVVSRIVGSEYGNEVPNLDAGEGFVQTDWTDGGIRRVQFDRKRTFDAGATPGLDDFERPELKSVSDALMQDLEGITELQEQEHDRVAELESQLERKQAQVAELENELQTARDVSNAARKMANALAHGDIGGPEEFEDQLREKNERIRELEARLEELENERTEQRSFQDWEANTEDAAEVEDVRDRGHRKSRTPRRAKTHRTSSRMGTRTRNRPPPTMPNHGLHETPNRRTASRRDGRRGGTRTRRASIEPVRTTRVRSRPTNANSRSADANSGAPFRIDPPPKRRRWWSWRTPTPSWSESMPRAGIRCATKITPGTSSPRSRRVGR